MKRTTRHGAFGLLGSLLAALSMQVGAQTAAPDLAPLPESKPVNAAQAELGKYLFFDTRLSGDSGVSCATCHDPAKGWADGLPLSRGYTSVEYFRNAPTVLNAKFKTRFMWDGRLDGSDLGTLTRDMVTEAHFMNADGRIVQERLQQIPEYVAMWEKAFKPGADPYGPRMFNVVAEFVKTLESKNVPFDKFVKGDANAIGAQAKDGLALFRGKAGCVACHNGPLGSDQKFHATGVPENPEVLANPLRHITMLRHYATSGMPNYMNARSDVGLQAITKNARDGSKFLTAGLRELKYTAPYMHNGVFKTLDEVVEFYDRGGGKGSGLKPLGLSAAEKQALVAFLETLSGDPVTMAAPKLPEMKIRPLAKQ
jgi:cytochrome c peroxidase